MGVKKYLDELGLATLWEKIKNIFAKKSDIPVVNNAKLTVLKNGTNIGTFTANQSTDATINITVPTGAAANKDVDTSIASGSTSLNLPTSLAVAEHVNSQIKTQVTDLIGTTITPLGKDGVVPAAYLPSYVDDIVEGYYSNGKFYTSSSYTQEIADEASKIYVDLTENKTYRWSGTMFVEISKSLAIGTIAGTAYDGASGAKNASDIVNLQIKIDTKVDKVEGKGLSTNDYTNEEKNKLANIANGAEVNVLSDWDVTDTSSDAFIKNKPTIPTIATSSKAGTIKSGGDIEINNEGVVTVKQANDVKTDKYLNKENSTQLSMKTKTIVTNLNADLIDGYHSIEQFKLGNCNPDSKGPAFGRGAYSGNKTSVAIGQGSYSSDNTGDNGSYNNILGANVVLKKISYYPIEFKIGNSSDIIYATYISKLEELTINFKENNTNIFNDTDHDCILVILPVELFYKSEKYATITAGSEHLYDISIIYSGLNPLSKARIQKQEKIIIDDTTYTILLLTDFLDVLPINFNLISSDTQFKCTGINDVVGGYAAIVGYGSSGYSFSAILGRNNHAEYLGCAIGQGNKLFGSSSVGIGNYNLSLAGNAYLLGLCNQGIANGGMGIGLYLNVTSQGCVIGKYNDTNINSMYYSLFAIGTGSSESNRRTSFHVFLTSLSENFYLGSGKEDRDTIKLIFHTKSNSSINYSIVYNNINKWLESRIGDSTTSIFPTSGGMFDPSTGDIRTLMRYKDVLHMTSPISEALNNKVDRSEINQPLEFDVTYNLGNASSENAEYVKLFSVNDGYAVELLIAIEGPFGTYRLEKCVANCAYYPSVTTDSTKLYYQQKLFSSNHVNILMKLLPKGRLYPDQKIRLKLLKAFRKDNTPVTDIYSAITWGEGIKLTNIVAIDGQTLKYFPTISKPTDWSSIINLTLDNINNSKVDIDCTTSTSWFIKSDITNSIDSLFTINSSAFPAAGIAIDFIFDVDFKNGINLALSNSIVATYSEPLYKGDKLTFIVPESNDEWYIKLTPVSIISNSLSVDIDDSGRTNLEVIPISDEKIVACCVL